MTLHTSDERIDGSVVYRQSRGRELRSTLRAMAGKLGGIDAPELDDPAAETMGSFALLNHMLYELERGAREHDAERMIAAYDLAPFVAGATEHAKDDALSFQALDARLCRRNDDERFGSTLYSATPAALTGETPLPPGVLDTAVEAIAEAGFRENLANGLGACVFFDQAGEATIAFGYSIGVLPGTVFAEWSKDPIVVGECILHEASHSWLTMLLTAADEKLPPGPFAYSPWKEVERPAFGLLQSGFAFSIVTLYCRRSAGSRFASPETKRYCEIREDIERRRVAMARPDVERVLDLLDSESIVELVRGVMDQSQEE